MDNEQAIVREKITELYRDYEARDLPKVLAGLPDEFCFEWASDPGTARYAGICRGKGELVEALEDIAEHFEFNAYRATNILVDGGRAAAQLTLDLTSKLTGRRFSAKLAHFWKFQNGVPVHLVEYMDTALIASESGPRSVPQRNA